jgi:CheY-like chemotaxis protein
VFPDDVQRARAAGCELFLDKPCYPEDVASAIERMLASRQASTGPGPIRPTAS